MHVEEEADSARTAGSGLGLPDLTKGITSEAVQKVIARKAASSMGPIRSRDFGDGGVRNRRRAPDHGRSRAGVRRQQRLNERTTTGEAARRICVERPCRWTAILRGHAKQVGVLGRLERY